MIEIIEEMEIDKCLPIKRLKEISIDNKIEIVIKRKMIEYLSIKIEVGI